MARIGGPERTYRNTNGFGTYLHYIKGYLSRSSNEESRDTLDKYSREHGHEEGGPVNVGGRRNVLRWNRDTVDAWFRRVAGIAPPKPLRRKSPVKSEAPLERFDWSTV